MRNHFSKTALLPFATICLASCVGFLILQSDLIGESANGQELSKPKPSTQLLVDLDSRDFQKRNYATTELSKRGHKVIPSVVRLIVEGTTEQRYRASLVLANQLIKAKPDEAAKLTRILHLLADNGQPGLLTLAERSREQWKKSQLANTIKALKKAGADVQSTVAYGQFELDGALPAEWRRTTEIIPAKPSKEKKTASSKKAKVEKKKLKPNQIFDSVDEILAAKPSDDHAEVAKLGRKKPRKPTIEEIKAQFDRPHLRVVTPDTWRTATTCQTVTIGKGWKGTENDFAKIALLPKVTSISISEIDVSNKMLDIIERLPVTTVQILRCDFDSSRVRDYAKKHPNVYVNVRGKALLGVRGPIAGGSGTALNGGPCVISEVIQNSAADRAGLVANDRILKVDDNRVKTFQDLVFEVAGRKIGTSVKLTVKREGKTKTLTLKLGDAADPKVRVDD